MDTVAANGILKWAAALRDIRFCLLEQLLPDGPESPFGKMMNEHFGKLGTPLKSVLMYPRLDDQKRRFQDAGFTHVLCRTLWDLWSTPAFLTTVQKAQLDIIEP